MDYYAAQKRKKILSFSTTWISLKNFMLNEMSFTERQIMNDLLNMRHKNRQMSGTRQYNYGYQGMEWGVYGGLLFNEYKNIFIQDDQVSGIYWFAGLIINSEKLLNSFISYKSLFYWFYRAFYIIGYVICKQRLFSFFLSILDAFYFCDLPNFCS